MSLGVCCLYIPKLMFLSFFYRANDLFSIKNKNSDYD